MKKAFAVLILASVAVAAWMVNAQTLTGNTASPPAASGPAAYHKPSDSQLREQLSSLQYDVTQNDATERPFDNRYWNEKRAGIYVDIVSGEPLFSSRDKFVSGTGWPKKDKAA